MQPACRQQIGNRIDIMRYAGVGKRKIQHFTARARRFYHRSGSHVAVKRRQKGEPATGKADRMPRQLAIAGEHYRFLAKRLRHGAQGSGADKREIAGQN